MTAAEAVARARSAIGKKIGYGLGKGGMHPEHAVPCDENNLCDCSGFVCWAMGVSRWRDAPKHPLLSFDWSWFQTSSIRDDAAGPHRCFNRVQTPKPGDLIVYGDRKVNGKTVQGHVGMIGDVFMGSAASVIHCSMGNFKATLGDSIQETPVAHYWESNGAIFARPLFYEPEAVGAAEGSESNGPA